MKRIFLLALITAATNTATYAQCLEKYPQKYAFQGTYGLFTRDLKLSSQEKSYDCFYTNKIQFMNIKCSDELYLSISGHEGNLEPNGMMLYKGKTYELIAASGKTPNGTRKWYKQIEDCLADKMVRKDSAKYGIKGFDKSFTLEITTEVKINK
jgi:hypothetical protein